MKLCLRLRLPQLLLQRLVLRLKVRLSLSGLSRDVKIAYVCGRHGGARMVSTFGLNNAAIFLCPGIARAFPASTIGRMNIVVKMKCIILLTSFG